MMGSLRLDLVRTPEHVIDTREVVRAGEHVFSTTFRCIVLLEVRLLTKITHLYAN